MASSVIQVCNRALTKLGSARIVDLLDDSRQARALNAAYEPVRDLVLRTFRWGFALKRALLSASATPPAFGFNYQYVLPSDYLLVDQVGEQMPTVGSDSYVGTEIVDYAIENGRLLTDMAAPLALRYVARITDPTVWDAHFAEVLACKLAWELCEELTQSDAKRQLAQGEFRNAVAAAIKVNAILRVPTQFADGNWINSRI